MEDDYVMTVAFIGTGNMGGALACAAAKSPLCTRLLLSNRSPSKALALCDELGAEVTDNRCAAAEADVLFFGVKPQGLESMVSGIRDVLEARERCVIVSMAAGWTVSALEKLLGGLPVVRILPNIPVAVGEGVTLFCASDEVTKEEKSLVIDLLSSSGMVAELTEDHMDAASGITGCGPAFAAMFIDALADGAVACGLPRAQAIRYAAQMLAGSAQMLLESGEHPGVLKDRVCSPGGSTIQGVRKLEERAFRGAVTDAVIATWEKEF